MPRLEERKVVTVLFCDLVGFTAMSETADPEDVDRMLDGVRRTWPAPRSPPTAASSRSSSAMRSSASSASRRRTRTTPCGLSGPAWTSVDGAGEPARRRWRDPSPPGRDQHRRGPRPARRRARSRRTVHDRRCDQHRRRGSSPSRRSRASPSGEATWQVTRSTDRLRGAAAGDAQRQGGAGPCLPRDRRANRSSAIDPSRTHGRRLRGPDRRARAVCRSHLRSSGRPTDGREFVARHRRARDRQEPVRRRAPRVMPRPRIRA